MEILITDDDPVVRHILGSILESADYSVIQTESGSECLALLSERAAEGNFPALLFLDLMLGDMSGTEVLTKLRKTISEAQLPVVMLSANPKEEMVNMPSEVTPSYYMEKPFTPEGVLTLLDEVLKTQS